MSDPVNGDFQTSDGCAISYTLHPDPARMRRVWRWCTRWRSDRSIWDGVVKEITAHAAVLHLRPAAAMAGRTVPT